MENDDGSDPTIEVRELSPLEVADLAIELGVAVRELYLPTLDVGVTVMESARAFEAAPREIQEAILMILRSVAKKRPARQA